MNLNMHIKESDQEDVMTSFWQMLQEVEHTATNENNPMLKHFVEGWYKQWNSITGDNNKPRWVKF